MHGFTDTSHQSVIAAALESVTGQFGRNLHRSRSILNSAKTKDIGGVGRCLSTFTARGGSSGTTIVHDNGHTVHGADTQGAFHIVSVRIFQEVQQFQASHVSSDLAVHKHKLESVLIVAHGLLDSVTNGGRTHLVCVTNGSGSGRQVGSVVCPTGKVTAAGHAENRIEDFQHDGLALLLPILRHLRHDLLHRVSAAVVVNDEVLLLPTVRTTEHDTVLSAASGVGQGNVGCAIVVLRGAADDLVEGQSVEIRAVSDQPCQLCVRGDSAALEHSGQSGVFCVCPVVVKQLRVKRKTEIGSHSVLPP